MWQPLGTFCVIADPLSRFFSQLTNVGWLCYSSPRSKTLLSRSNCNRAVWGGDLTQHWGNDDIRMELVKCITQMKRGISRAAFYVATVVKLKSYCRAPAAWFKKSDIFIHTCERKTSHCSFLNSLTPPGFFFLGSRSHIRFSWLDIIS